MRLVVTLERDETSTIVADRPAIPGCEARAASGMPVTIAIREVEGAV
jgi:hypothetical protein